MTAPKQTLRHGSWLGVLVLAAAASSAAEKAPALHHQKHPEESPILAFYDFEAPSPSGPDTFWIRQPGGGEVALSSAFRRSGDRSLHITEVRGNRDFAEFLAYFRERREGHVFIQFYLLLTDPGQTFNFGLAGRRWFLSRERHGHAVWLQTKEGLFRHQPKEGWQDLFAPQPFAWYFVDVLYDVESGVYDLAIFEEGSEAPVAEVRRSSGLNGHRDSSVRYFSLIGDLEDAASFDFFVDDLVIATDPAVRQRPFVAPGRRWYFVDRLAAGPRIVLEDTELEDLLWHARTELESLEDGDEEAANSLEYAADRAFWAGALDEAEEIYSGLVRLPDRQVRLLLKLSDIAHLRGEVDAERDLRERIYGRLAVED